MALKHDAQGFLTGDPIDIGRALKVWDDIHDDVRAIRRALTSGASGGSARPGRADKTSNEVARPMAPAPSTPRSSSQIPALLRKTATPQTGGASASAIRRDAQAVEVAGQAVAAVRAASQATQRAIAKPVSRDGRGRFVRGEGRGGSGAPGSGGGNGGGGDGEETGALRGVADRIAGAIRESGSGMEEADPAVKAMNEVARPMARGYELLTGGSREKRQEGWLRRIWTSLTGFRKDETTFNKAANKSLKNIEEKPDAESGGGGGIFGTLMSMLKGIGPAIVAAIGGLLGKLGGGLGGIAKGAGGMLKGAGGFLKRVPLLGSLLSVFGAASDIADSEGDDTLSRREKDQRAGKAIGGAGGTIGGMMAGAALGSFLGPVGTLIGGAVGAFLGDQAGQIIGDKVGGWVNDLRTADIPGKISASWDATTSFITSAWDTALGGMTKGWEAVTSAFSAVGDTIGKTWQGFVDSAKAGWDTIAGLFSSAYEGLKSIPVIGPAIQAVEDAAKKTAEAASAAVGAAKQKAVEVGTKAVEGAKAGVEYLGNNTTIGKGVKATGEAVNYGVDVAVDTGRALKSKLTGQAGRNQQALMNQMAASGITDPTEQAMFMAQMDHESGGFTKMEERFNYRSADRLMAVSGSARKQGKASVEAAMAQGPEAVAELMYGGRMGNSEKGDAYRFRGRGAIQLTGKDNYAAAGKDLGLDLVNSPELAADPENAAKIAAWYWKKNPKLSAAGKAGNVEAATQVINGGQNGVEHRKELFAKYQAEGVGATESPAANQPPATAVAEATAPAAQPAPAVALASAPPAMPAYAGPVKQAVVASASAPSVHAAPSVPALAEAPPVTIPMASNSSSAPIQVSMPSPDVGQDVRDRGIAHIVTGGLSA